MKKEITATVFILFALSVSAQDTIHSRSLKSSYYQYNWLDTTIDECVRSCYKGQYKGSLRGKRIIPPKDALTIAGIAFSPGLRVYYPWDSTDWYTRNFLSGLMDTSLDNAYEYISMYQYDVPSGDYLPISDSLCVHIRDTAPAYYLDLDMYTNEAHVFRHEPIPVFELFFDEPIIVQDTFYILMTQRSYSEDVTDSAGRTWPCSSLPVDINTFANVEGHDDRTLSYGSAYGWIHHHVAGTLFMFPILYTRPDSATPAPIGIEPPLLSEPTVEILPNPAAEHAQITSDTRLHQVAIYNSAGTVVKESLLTGFCAFIDLAHLPDDIYLVRIATAAGTVTRKLIVQRR